VGEKLTLSNSKSWNGIIHADVPVTMIDNLEW